VCDTERSFYRSANEIFGKIGNFVPENVTLQLMQSKCVPPLLYGLDACPLNKSDINSLDFVINQIFTKLFCTSDISIVSVSEQLAQRKDNFIRSLRCV